MHMNTDPRAQPQVQWHNLVRHRYVEVVRDLNKQYPSIVSGNGNYLYTQDGRKILDSSGGAAVSCLGHGNERVKAAVMKQMATGISYLASTFWRNPTVDELCQNLRDGTNQKMSYVYLTGSGVSIGAGLTVPLR